MNSNITYSDSFALAAEVSSGGLQKVRLAVGTFVFVDTLADEEVNYMYLWMRGLVTYDGPLKAHLHTGPDSKDPTHAALGDTKSDQDLK